MADGHFAHSFVVTGPDWCIHTKSAVAVQPWRSSSTRSAVTGASCRPATGDEAQLGAVRQIGCVSTLRAISHAAIERRCLP